MSVFLPYVFKNISDARIAHAFERNDLAVVDHIDRVTKTDKNGKQYDSVYVHFTHWFESPEVARFQQSVIDKKGRIVYDDPWFWQVFENTGTKREPEQESSEPKEQQTKEPHKQEPQENVAPQQQQPEYEQLYYTHEAYYMPPPYTLPQFPLPFMPPANEEQMLVHVDYVAKLEQEYARVVAENTWLKNLVAELDANKMEESRGHEMV
jgi:hypothetical protein